MKISEIKKAPYNPRKMSKDAREALKKSLESFDDISGIVINKTSGNILAGNHRWETLSKQHGKNNLELKQVNGEYYSLDAKGTPTGFLVRIVEWDEAKEKAANISANNDLIQGEFTQGLQEVLADLEDLKFDMELFTDLRLDELQIDLDGIDEDLDWDDDKIDKVQQDSIDNNDALPNPKKEADGEVKELLVQIKVTVPDDLKDKVKEDLLEFLAGQYYYGQINIV
jgi:hypothetical protein